MIRFQSGRCVGPAVLAMACAAVVPARADSWIGDSLELQAADAEIVVSATMVSVEAVSVEGYSGFRVAIQVTKTLKGDATEGKTIECLASHEMERYFANWQKDKTPLLVFLVKSERLRPLGSSTAKEMPAAWTVRATRGDASGIVPLDGSAYWRAPTTDFKFLTKGDEILKRTTEAIAAGKESKVQRDWRGVMPSMEVAVPFDSALDKELHSMSSNGLMVPVTESMQADARKWVKAEDGAIRERGVYVLSQFKSDENLAIMKSLLNDPLARDQHFGNGTSAMVFPVRQAAEAALKVWEATPATVPATRP